MSNTSFINNTTSIRTNLNNVLSTNSLSKHESISSTNLNSSSKSNLNFINKYSNNFKDVHLNNNRLYLLYKELPKVNEFMFGENILNKYYSTKYIIEQLKDLYETITNIIKLNKPLFDTKVNTRDFIFNENNFILYNKLTNNKEKDYKELFSNNLVDDLTKKILTNKENKLDDLINNFSNNGGFVSLSGNKNNSFFYNSFKKFYNSHNRPYFMSLFKSYNNIRNQLLKSIPLINNHGLLSIGPIIGYNINNSNNINEKNKNKENVNDYSIYNLITINNSLYKSNFSSEGNKPKEESNKNSSNTIEDSNNVNYSAYYNRKNTLTPIYSDYTKNIKIIYNKMYDSLYNLTIANTQVQISLYDLLMTSIELDYYSLLFFYSYIQEKQYHSILETSLKINDYVYLSIKKYNTYLSNYLTWKSTFINNKKINEINMINDNINKSLKFEETLDTYLIDYNNVISKINDEYEEITDDVKSSLASTRDMINLLIGIRNSS